MKKGVRQVSREQRHQSTNKSHKSMSREKQRAYKRLDARQNERETKKLDMELKLLCYKEIG
jgi:hypothetical protein